MTGRLSLKIVLGTALLVALLQFPRVQTVFQNEANAQLVRNTPYFTPSATSSPTPSYTQSPYRTPYSGYAPTPRSQTPQPLNSGGQAGPKKGILGSTRAGTGVRGTPGKQGISKQGPSAGAAHPESNYEVPEVKFPADAVRTALLFTPPDTITQPNKDFEVDVTLSNMSGKAATGFEFVVAYDPKRLNFVKYDASALTPYVDKGQKALEFERQEGGLSFSCELTRPLDAERQTLVKLIFSATNVIGSSELRFLTPPNGHAAVYAGEANILGGNTSEFQGVLPSIITIAPRASDEALDAALAATGVEPATATPGLKGWMEGPKDTSPDAPVSLALQAPEQTSVTVGQNFWVDLVLYNDHLAPISSVGVTVRFDPKVLQVVDEDQDNWIARGINIWDGAFHDAYPFDLQEADKADNAAGAITYRMGRYADTYSFPTGIFARVHFRAIASAPATSIAIARGDEGGHPLTYVNAFGANRLMQTKEVAPNVSMRVVAQSKPVPELPVR